MYVVDRKKHPNKWKAIFYSLSLNRNGKTWQILAILFAFFLTILLFLFLDIPFARIAVSYILGPFIIIMPFARCCIVYYSKLEIKNGRYRIYLDGLTYMKGSLDQVIGVYRLKNWEGCFLIRTPGIAAISGFIIYTDNLPEELKHLKLVDGIHTF